MAHLAINKANDLFRTTLGQHPLLEKCKPIIHVTEAVDELPPFTKALLITAVRNFKDFGEHNDPHHEHDFGAVKVKGETFFFKIDYYAPGMEQGADDPTDLDNTVRVMTIMHASEY
jgi:hypothetical protein